MSVARRQEIGLEIEKLLTEIKILDAQGRPTDTYISRIAKLLQEYKDLYRIEREQGKVLQNI